MKREELKNLPGIMSPMPFEHMVAAAEREELLDRMLPPIEKVERFGPLLKEKEACSMAEVFAALPKAAAGRLIGYNEKVAS